MDNCYLGYVCVFVGDEGKLHLQKAAVHSGRDSQLGLLKSTL